MNAKVNGVTISIVKGDITYQTTDAIVNAANSGLMGGGGVDGAIHWAGGPAILKECKRIVARFGRLPAGQAVATTAGNLKARYVIHTVGPVWRGGAKGEPETLANAYSHSLKLAEELKLTSVSLPAISTGAYGYPPEKAANIAIVTAVEFAAEYAGSVKEIIFVLYDDKTYSAFEKALTNR
jgi:O-acetyl-ADP-ribose deacetylase (regulator of RNase III)